MKKTLGEKLKDLRIENNLTQSELGEKLHVSRNVISKWENNISEPDIAMIKDICKIFDIKTSDLIDDITPMNKVKSLIIKILKFLRRHCVKIIFGILLMLMAFYTFNTFNQTHLYEIRSSDKKFTISSGYYFDTKPINILIINGMNYELEDDEKIKVKLYTYIDNDKTYFYESDNLDDIKIEDKNGEVINELIADAIRKMLYVELEITNEDNQTTMKNVKLIIRKMYANNKIFDFSNMEDMSEVYIKNTKIPVIDTYTLANKGFKKTDVDNLFVKKINGVEIYIATDVNSFYYTVNEKSIQYSYVYYFTKDIIVYTKTNRDTKLSQKVINKFIYDLKTRKVTNQIGNTENYEKISDEVISLFNKIFS